MAAQILQFLSMHRFCVGLILARDLKALTFPPGWLVVCAFAVASSVIGGSFPLLSLVIGCLQSVMALSEKLLAASSTYGLDASVLLYFAFPSTLWVAHGHGLISFSVSMDTWLYPGLMDAKFISLAPASLLPSPADCASSSVFPSLSFPSSLSLFLLILVSYGQNFQQVHLLKAKKKLHRQEEIVWLTCKETTHRIFCVCISFRGSLYEIVLTILVLITSFTTVENWWKNCTAFPIQDQVYKKCWKI